MSTPQMPFNNQIQAFSQRASQIWQGLTTPHPSIQELGSLRRARLLSILTLILSALFISAFIYGPRTYGVFLALSGITLTSYALSRTRYYRIGVYLFTYVFTTIGYLRIYQGTADSIEAAVVSTVHVSLVMSSVLLSQRGFLALVILSTVATFTAPIYSNVPVSEMENIGRTGGIVLVIGAILYGINIFRANLDKEQHKELSDANRALGDVKENLEERIQTRTLELQEANRQVQERAARLQVISELSQEISSSVGLKSKEMLTRIAQSVSEKLGYYHVGVFLLDENREYAVLHAANSKGGQQMLERRHQLRVGGTGIVGYAAQSGHPRIALDTGSDAVFFNNPDLPETRSEIALPLKYGASIIGVLDVQSTLPSKFDNEDVKTLSTLANQIAIGIRNLQMLDETEIDTAQKKTSQLDRRKTQSGYSVNPDGTITSALPEKNPTLDKAIASGETVVLAQPSKGTFPTLAVPVKLRDQVVGVIQIEAAEPNRKWTEDEIAMVQAVSDRAALALENARLFESATRRAEQEETIARVTTQIGSSTDFNRILQTTIQELGQALGASRSFIQLNASSENGRDTTTE
jgi:GAF domain-containing protein